LKVREFEILVRVKIFTEVVSSTYMKTGLKALVILFGSFHLGVFVSLIHRFCRLLVSVVDGLLLQLKLWL